MHPVAKLNATEQYQMLLDAISVIKKNGGVIISLISDNAPTNVKTFKLMGGPGKVTVELEGQVHMLFLVYDYVHLFKNIRNNWITEMTQQLNFTFNGKPYLACWSDVISLYEEDRKSPIRLMKLTNTSVYPKPLQRQSVPLVCQVFNDKTVAAFKALKGTVDYSEGTVIFIELITNWFKTMNVKDKYTCIRYRDELREPWTFFSGSFERLSTISDVIKSCHRSPGMKRVKSLTSPTSNEFVVTTETNILAAQHLLTEHKFEYVLPAINSTDPAEKFFGQTIQRMGGSFYIDIVDVMAAAKMQVLHQLLKLDIVPDKTLSYTCPSCTEEVTPDSISLVQNLVISDTQSLLESTDPMKHKIIYIAGYLTKKYTGDDATENVSSEFLDELNWGGFSIPTLSTVFFVHSGIHIQTLIQTPQTRCRSYLMKLLSHIDSRIANDPNACKTLANILLKSFVTANSDKEQTVGCLRRKEKLSVTK